MADKLSGKVAEMIEPHLKNIGLRVYDVFYGRENGGRVLRLTIDKPGGHVTIEECEAVSVKLSGLLDADDLISESYALEVSSPGIERRLKEDWHYEEAVGEIVSVKLYTRLDGEKEIYGELVSGSSKGDVTIIKDNRELTVKRGDISDVRIYFEF